MNRLLNRLTNLVLLSLSTLSLVYLISDSFSCRTESSLLFWLLAACLLLWVAASFPKGLWYGMPLSAILLYGAYRYYDADPIVELSDLLDRVTGAFYTHVSNPGAVYPYADAAESHSLILLFLGFLLAAFCITALNSKEARLSLSLLGSLPLVAACVIVNGKIPALCAAGMLLFWFLLAVTGNGFHPDGSAGRSLLCCLLPVALLLGGILMLNRPEDYVYTEHDLELSRRFDRLGHYFDLFMGGPSSSASLSDPDQPADTSGPRSHFKSTWDGEDDSMELTQDYDFDHTDLPVLRVKSETTGRLYLRTRSFGDYTGKGWRPAEELSSGSSLPFSAFAASTAAETTRRQLEVHTLADLDELCLPYYSAISSGSDAFVSSDGQESYLISYNEYTGNIMALRLPQESRGAEEAYRVHAHSVYTRLPDNTREAALQICRNAGFDANDPEVVKAVARYVQKYAVYDLQTEPYPSDDYAIYFLTEAHRGYCIHYATAAAVLYRALGIPARVTEGFMVETRADRSIDVLAGNAHAWVEIYVDGTGWIPVEVTEQAGYATQEPEPTPEPTPESTPEPSPEPSENPDGEDGPGASVESPSPDPTQDPASSPEPSPTQQEAPRSELRKSVTIPWSSLLILLLLLLLLPFWYWALRAYRTTQIRNPDGHRAAVACWKYAKRVSAYGPEIPEVIVQTAEKAAFSPHMIHREEMDRCRSALREMIEELYPKLTKLQKFRFRFLSGLK